MYKRILLPTDGSEASRRAVAAAIDFAKDAGAELVAMTATPALHIFAGDAGVLDAPDEPDDTANAQAHHVLDEVAALARGAGVPCTCVQHASDHPHEAIIATARDHQCDLIVMASHGNKGLKGLLLGSETHKVLVHSAIPVLVLR
jgi:nucleotide-binding universal stress UspA family protein